MISAWEMKEVKLNVRKSLWKLISCRFGWETTKKLEDMLNEKMQEELNKNNIKNDDNLKS